CLNPSPIKYSIFSLTGQYDMDDLRAVHDVWDERVKGESALSLEDKQFVYMIFMKKLLQENEIKDIFIYKNLIVGKYKSLDFMVKCLILENQVLVFPVHVKTFLKEMEERPREVHGFLVCSSPFSNQVVEVVRKQSRVFISNENELSNIIKDVETISTERRIKKLEEIIREKDSIIEALKKVAFDNNLSEEEKNNIKESLF
ncbi:15206_t:CDS:2, partial [Dentiscutata erythropus]